MSEHPSEASLSGPDLLEYIAKRRAWAARITDGRVMQSLETQPDWLIHDIVAELARIEDIEATPYGEIAARVCAAIFSSIKFRARSENPA